MTWALPVAAHIDKGFADDLALSLGIGFSSEGGQESVLGVDANHLHAEMLGEGCHDLVALVLTQQAIVDKHAGELVANGLMQQCSDDRGVNATG